MATNVNSINNTVTAVGRGNEVKGQRIVTGKEGGSEAFAKETHVRFSNSVGDLSAVLEKLSELELKKEGLLPRQLQQLIGRVMQNAFSVDSSLGGGVGSALSSERYAIQQLNMLNRIFQQLGSGMEEKQGFSKELMALMDNLKLAFANKQGLEPVLLNKIAFHMLNDSQDNLSPTLATVVNSLTKGEGAKELLPKEVKGLFELLFPKQLGEKGKATGVAESGQGKNLPGEISRVQANSLPKGGESPNREALLNKNPQVPLAKGQGEGGFKAGIEFTLPKEGEVPVNATLKGQASLGKEGELPVEAGRAKGENANVSSAPAKKEAQEFSPLKANSLESIPSEGKSHILKQAAQVENNPLFKQIFAKYGYTQEVATPKGLVQAQTANFLPLQNNLALVTSLKAMAELILKDSGLNNTDRAMLQSFVTGTEEKLASQDAKQLESLLRIVEGNMPAAIKQAGLRPGLDNLPKLWTLLQLAELGSLKEVRPRDFKVAGKHIQNVISSLQGSVASEGAYKGEGERSISFIFPLYWGENTESVPAYIHIYDEPAKEEGTERKRRDTWFRVCVLTEFLGAVDIVCQLYDGRDMNMRITFADKEAVQEFQEFLPEIRRSLYDTSINLVDLKIGTVI